MMGDDEEPEREIFIAPEKLSPLLNKTESPGCSWSEKKLNCVMVCQAVAGDVPEAPSFPVAEK